MIGGPTPRWFVDTRSVASGGDRPLLPAAAVRAPEVGPPGSARVAVIHDWLVSPGGAERVLAEILRLFPQADLFAAVSFPEPDLERLLDGRRVQSTFIQRLPGARARYRSYFPLMPLAIEQLDLSGYDLVLSSSHAVAKGVLTGPDQLHVSYVHSPMRYAWDLQHQYLREAGLDRGAKGWLAKCLLHRLRIWDLRTANGVDRFAANSQFIRRRIAKVYRRDATVIYPPVDVDTLACVGAKEDFYLTASRMVPYKRIALIVDAFVRSPGRKLVVAGEGPEFENVKSRAGKNIEILGYCPKDQLRDLMQRARAFVFAAEEDFGITPVEAQACGTPVIAYGRGGVTESVRGLQHDSPTGVFFGEQSPDAIIAAVELFERNADRITASACRDRARQFAPERFRAEYLALVSGAWEAAHSSA